MHSGTRGRIHVENGQSLSDSHEFNSVCQKEKLNVNNWELDIVYKVKNKI
jgi:hypothetical protein